MITPADLAAVPLLADVPPDDLARAAARAADLRLAAGDAAVSAGDERALYLVLDGHFEVLKLVDGIERVIGHRERGDVFGEIPIVFGIPFQGTFRAARPSRVARIGAQAYHELAAGAPAMVTRLAALAGERMGGLQGIAAQPARARALVLGHRWDPLCHEYRRFLGRNQIPFEWLSPDAGDVAERWGGPPPAEADLPALRCEDGTTLARPSVRALAERLELRTRPSATAYDTVIVGGGPAGLAAAVYGASEGLRTLVVEREAPGGQAGTSTRIENYLGFPSGVSGDELAQRALQQARRLGAEIVVTRGVDGLDVAERAVVLDGGERIRAATIVVATGVAWRRLDVEGADRLLGKGVYYGAARSDAAMTQGLDVHLIGAGNSAGQSAIFFAGHARSVTLLVRGDALEKSMSHYLIEQIRAKPNVHVLLRTEVAAVHGRTNLDALDLVDRRTGDVRRVPSGGLYAFIGADAETAWLPDAIARDARGYVLTGDAVVRAGRWRHDRDPYVLESSVPGIFAVGDVRASMVKRVAAAVGEGSMAIAFVHQHLQHEASRQARSGA